jgi:RNA polymerase sigma-70 factor (ECF subfamily)
MQVDDATLIQRSRFEPTAFAELYDRHAAEIHRFVARRIGNQAADDAVAETFLAAFRRRDRYDLAREDARPWLFGIAVNVIGKHRRSERRQLRALARVDADPNNGDDLVQAHDRIAAAGARSQLADALAKLPAEIRDVLLLVALADLSYEEVATALQVPIGTVRSRLSRARSKLRDVLAVHDPMFHEGGAIDERA